MTSERKTSKAINITLWIAQVFLAITFIPVGLMQIFQPEKLPFPWLKDSAGFLVLFTGVIDMVAGIGLVLPALLRIQPKLTIYAAYGTIVLMITASIFHISRGEAKDIGFNIFVTFLAVFIVWGRQTKAIITPK